MKQRVQPCCECDGTGWHDAHGGPEHCCNCGGKGKVRFDERQLFIRGRLVQATLTKEELLKVASALAVELDDQLIGNGTFDTRTQSGDYVSYVIGEAICSE